MPTATSTFKLNISAIKALCDGTDGRTILNGTNAPSSLSGEPGDFYLNTTNYVLFGPKDITNTWILSASLMPPVTSTDITSLFGQVSSYLFSPTAGFFSASGLEIGNSTATGITIESLNNPSLVCNASGSGPITVASFAIDNVSKLSISDSTTTISNSTVNLSGNFISRGNSSFLLEAPGNQFRVTDKIHISGNQIAFGSLTLISQPALTEYGVIIGGGYILNLAKVSTFGHTGTNNVIINHSNVASKVGINLTSNQYSLISAYPANFTVNGSVSSQTLSCANYFDNAGNQVLTLRQVAPAKLSLVTSTTADIINSFNSLLNSLTAHGLIR